MPSRHTDRHHLNTTQATLKMANQIPSPLISVVADIVSQREKHATPDSLFLYSGAPEDPPLGSKHVKVLE